MRQLNHLEEATLHALTVIKTYASTDKDATLSILARVRDRADKLIAEILAEVEQ